MLVNSISSITDLYLGLVRNTEYKSLKDETTGKTYVGVSEHFDLVLYDSS